jgi:CheY-like chemotaxis protein
MTHKLLLADDSVTIQRVIELTFADEDIDVIAVSDGRQAIEHLQRNRPDIVLADVGMPEQDGYAVASFIKKHKDLSQIPVLLLTGAFEPIDEARAKAVGCDGVLVKPFEPQMVISRVKDLLAGRRTGPSIWAQMPAVDASAKARSGFDLGGPASSTPPPAPAGSLEAYFDRLDAAFASLDAGVPDAPARDARASAAPPQTGGDMAHPHADAPPSPAASPFGISDDLAGWDPDIAGDPSRPAPVEPRQLEREPAPPTPPARPAAVVPEPAAYQPPQAPLAVEVPPAVSQPQAAAPEAPAADRTRPVTHQAAVAVPDQAPAAAYQPPAAPYQAPAAYNPTAYEPQPPATATAPQPLEAAPVETPAAESNTIPASGRMPSLAEAFATLLAAEQGQHFSPPITAAQQVPDQVVDEIVRKVIARMGDNTVRDAVLEVAERLVRDEIARIKSA